jgi:SAM-dependent methyltransferase
MAAIPKATPTAVGSNDTADWSYLVSNAFHSCLKWLTINSIRSIATVLTQRSTMASLPKVDTYPLARGVIDSVRLNLCHFIWKKSFPWVVHPSISLEGRPDLRIADVGCGTGLAQSSIRSSSSFTLNDAHWYLFNSIWLLEAAEDYPNAEALEGLDIALHQAPAQHLLPDNVHFKYLDMQEDIPAEFVGRYDLVHARFLLGLVKNNDPVPLLQNLLKLLSQ